VNTASHVNTRSARSEDLRTLVLAGVFLALLAVTVQTVLYVADVYALDRRVQSFDVDREGGVATWAASVAIFSTGFVALLLGFVEPSRRLLLLVLAGATIFLSFDEYLMVHERLGLRVTEALDLSDKYLRIAWPAIYLPLLATVAALIFYLARTSIGPARSLLGIGLVTLAAAVGLEIAGLALDLIPSLPERGYLYTAQITLEEGAELAGWILLTTGLAVRLLGPSWDSLERRGLVPSE
jgi:hypothetical protein